MTLEQFLEQVNSQPETIAFNDTIDIVDRHYDFTPSAFKNGDTKNEAGQNNGSCKVFAFGKISGLSEEQTLQCFGDYYRKDVLEHPDAEDHQNIRNFIKTGWAGIEFESEPLAAKN